MQAVEKSNRIDGLQYMRAVAAISVVVIHMLNSATIYLNTPPETVPLDRTNGAPRPLKWCVVTAAMVH